MFFPAKTRQLSADFFARTQQLIADFFDQFTLDCVRIPVNRRRPDQQVDLK
jgi:hypothetical protein